MFYVILALIYLASFAVCYAYIRKNESYPSGADVAITVCPVFNTLVAVLAVVSLINEADARKFFRIKTKG